MTAPHVLWLGPGGLWDFGPAPRRRLWRGPGDAGQANTGPAASHHADFQAWCQANVGRRCSMLLSGWLLHELVMDAALPLRNDPQRLAYARQLMVGYHGEAAHAWPMAVWHATGRHGVTALHALRLAELQDQALASRVSLRKLGPWWCGALALALVAEPRLARSARARLWVVDGLLATQVDLAQGRLAHVQQRRLAAPTLAGLADLQASLQDSLQDSQQADQRADQRADQHARLPPLDLCFALGHGLSPGPAVGPMVLLGSLSGRSPPAPWPQALPSPLQVAA